MSLALVLLAAVWGAFLSPHLPPLDHDGYLDLNSLTDTISVTAPSDPFIHATSFMVEAWVFIPQDRPLGAQQAVSSSLGAFPVLSRGRYCSVKSNTIITNDTTVFFLGLTQTSSGISLVGASTASGNRNVFAGRSTLNQTGIWYYIVYGVNLSTTSTSTQYLGFTHDPRTNSALTFETNTMVGTTFPSYQSSQYGLFSIGKGDLSCAVPGCFLGFIDEVRIWDTYNPNVLGVSGSFTAPFVFIYPFLNDVNMTIQLSGVTTANYVVHTLPCYTGTNASYVSYIGQTPVGYKWADLVNARAVYAQRCPPCYLLKQGSCRHNVSLISNALSNFQSMFVASAINSTTFPGFTGCDSPLPDKCKLGSQVSWTRSYGYRILRGAFYSGVLTTVDTSSTAQCEDLCQLMDQCYTYSIVGPDVSGEFTCSLFNSSFSKNGGYPNSYVVGVRYVNPVNLKPRGDGDWCTSTSQCGTGYCAPEGVCRVRTVASCNVTTCLFTSTCASTLQNGPQCKLDVSPQDPTIPIIGPIALTLIRNSSSPYGAASFYAIRAPIALPQQTMLTTLGVGIGYVIQYGDVLEYDIFASTNYPTISLGFTSIGSTPFDCAYLDGNGTSATVCVGQGIFTSLPVTNSWVRRSISLTPFQNLTISSIDVAIAAGVTFTRQPAFREVRIVNILHQTQVNILPTDDCLTSSPCAPNLLCRDGFNTHVCVVPNVCWNRVGCDSRRECIVNTTYPNGLCEAQCANVWGSSAGCVGSAWTFDSLTQVKSLASTPYSYDDIDASVVGFEDAYSLPANNNSPAAYLRTLWSGLNGEYSVRVPLANSIYLTTATSLCYKYLVNCTLTSCTPSSIVVDLILTKSGVDYLLSDLQNSARLTSLQSEWSDTPTCVDIPTGYNVTGGVLTVDFLSDIATEVWFSDIRVVDKVSGSTLLPVILTDDCHFNPCPTNFRCRDQDNSTYRCDLDRDWCAFNNGGCDSNAVCTNGLQWPPKCACKSGYYGDGITTCTMLTPCAAGLCDPIAGCLANGTCASCSNLYTQSFMAPYQIQQCTDVNECVTSGPTLCSGQCYNCVASSNCTQGYICLPSFVSGTLARTPQSSSLAPDNPAAVGFPVYVGAPANPWNLSVTVTLGSYYSTVSSLRVMMTPAFTTLSCSRLQYTTQVLKLSPLPTSASQMVNLTFTVPQEVGGPYNLAFVLAGGAPLSGVTTPCNTLNTSSDAFIFNPPTITPFTLSSSSNNIAGRNITTKRFYPVSFWGTNFAPYQIQSLTDPNSRFQTSDFSVYYGKSPNYFKYSCVIYNLNSTHVTCQMDKGSGSNYTFTYCSRTRCVTGTDTLSYTPVPTVTAVQGCPPPGCTADGGTRVTIVGSLLTQESIITIGGQECTQSTGKTLDPSGSTFYASIFGITCGIPMQPPCSPQVPVFQQIECSAPAGVGANLAVVVTWPCYGSYFDGSSSADTFVFNYAMPSLVSVQNQMGQPACGQIQTIPGPGPGPGTGGQFLMMSCSRTGGTLVITVADCGPNGCTLAIGDRATCLVTQSATPTPCNFMGGTDSHDLVLTQLNGRSVVIGSFIYMPCLPGSIPNQTQGNCTPCSSGKYSTEDICVACSPGYYSAPGSAACSPCDPGFFAPSPAVGTCISCPNFTISSSVGSTSCVTCGAGTYQIGRTQCQTCLAGKYTPPPGTNSATTCYDCPAGKYASDDGAYICLSCDPGQFSDTPSSTKCKKCMQGTYQDQAGATTCYNATLGYYSSDWESDSQTPCAAGSVAPQEGMISCITCTHGTVASDSTAVCTPCDPGTYGPSDGLTLCTPCPAGSYIDQFGQVSCNKCPQGKFQDDQGYTFCISCEAGTFTGEDGLLTCELCAMGTYAEEIGSGSCTLCPAGKATGTTNSARTACTDCEFGKYSPVPGSSECILCQEGWFANSTGSTSCTACPAGRLASSTGVSTCLECRAGSYADSEGSSVCSDCAAGNYSFLPGSTACRSCDQGQFATGTGTSRCASCAAGSYTPDTGSIMCTACEIGKHSSFTGANACLECTPGTTQTTTGSAECSECMPGRYSDKPGDLSGCQQCPVGYHTNATGSTVCFPCAAGTSQSVSGSPQCSMCGPGSFADQNNSVQCTPCFPGFYSSGYGNTACDACPIGSYQPMNGASRCLVCEAGTFAAKNASAACTDCPLGQYSSFTNSTACLQCPEGFYQFNSRSITCSGCAPGTFANSPGAAVCTLCAIGKYAESYNATDCRSCPDGSYQTASGAAECNVCPMGKYSAQEGTVTCVNCPKGKYTPFENSTECLECSIGTYQAVEGSESQCSGCDAGRYAGSNASTTCFPCATGRFMPSANATECLECGPGTYQSATGSTQCTPCLQGTYTNQNGTVSCSACGTGRYSPTIGARDCLGCPVGTSQPGTGQSSCSACSTGSIAAQPGMTECAKCSSTQIVVDPALPCVECIRYSNPNVERNLCVCSSGSVMVELEYATPAEIALYVGNSSQYNITGLCIPCPTGANCNAIGVTRANLTAAEGYSPGVGVNNLVFYPCPTASACPGTAAGKCAVGYTGNLCQQCAVGYGKGTSNDCVACGKISANAGKLFGLILLSILLLTFLVWNTIRNSTSATQGPQAILLKIFLSGVQFNSIAISLDYDWPPFLQSLFQAQRSVVNITTSIISIDCFLKNGINSISPVYVKTTIFLFLPIMVVLVAGLFFVLLTLYRAFLNRISFAQQETRKHIKDDFLTSVVIIFFLIHPSITQQCFVLFQCEDIGPVGSYLTADLSQRCWTKSHNGWVFGVGLPMLLIWVLGIPLSGLFLLCRNRSKIQAGEGLEYRRLQRKYAFLFRGYKKEVFFWEIIVVVRKVLLVMIAVFAAGNVQIQALLVVLLIVVAGILHVYYEPFGLGFLNRMEGLSLVVSFVIFFMGQFLFVTGASQTLRMFASSIILIFTIIFFLAFLIALLISLREIVVTAYRMAKGLPPLTEGPKLAEIGSIPMMTVNMTLPPVKVTSPDDDESPKEAEKAGRNNLQGVTKAKAGASVRANNGAGPAAIAVPEKDKASASLSEPGVALSGTPSVPGRHVGGSDPNPLLEPGNARASG